MTVRTTDTAVARLSLAVSRTALGCEIVPYLSPGAVRSGEIYSQTVVIERASGEKIERRLSTLSPMLLGSIHKVVGTVQEEERLRARHGRQAKLSVDDALDCLTRAEARLAHVTRSGLEALFVALGEVQDAGGRDICRLDSAAPDRVAFAEVAWRNALPFLVAERFDETALESFGLLPDRPQEFLPLLLQLGDRVRIPPDTRFDLLLRIEQRGGAAEYAAPFEADVGPWGLIARTAAVEPVEESRTPPAPGAEPAGLDIVAGIEGAAGPDDTGDPLISETIALEAVDPRLRPVVAGNDPDALRAELTDGGIEVPAGAEDDLAYLAGLDPMPSWLADAIRAEPRAFAVNDGPHRFGSPDLWARDDLPPEVRRRVAAALVAYAAGRSGHAGEATVGPMSGFDRGGVAFDALGRVLDRLLQRPMAARSLEMAMNARCPGMRTVSSNEGPLATLLLVSGALSETAPDFIAALVSGSADAAFVLAAADARGAAPRLVE